MSKLVDPNDHYVVEQGGSEKPIVLDMTASKLAFSRFHEIQNANTATFGELVTCFISANVELSNSIAKIKQELVKKDHRLSLMRARLLIEHVPVVLEQQKLKNTQEVCNSLILLNPEYSNLLFSYEALKAALEVLEAKIKTLRDAQFAIRDITQFNYDKKFTRSNAMDASDVRGKYSGEF